MSSISKHRDKKELELSTPIIFVITSFLGPTLGLKFFVLLIHVILEFRVDINYTGPEINDEHEFTIQHQSQHIL